MIFLDIETLDFFQDAHIARLPRPVQLATMRFGLATTYDGENGEWAQWWAGTETASLPGVTAHAVLGASDETILYSLWDFLGENTIVGWNILEFDLPLLMLHLALLGHARLAELPPYIDLMERCRTASAAYGPPRWYSLESVAQATLGRGKDGDGQAAARWLRDGDGEERRRAAAYCRNDVQLCVDLYAAAQTSGLLLPARPKRGEQGDLRLWLDERGNPREVVRDSATEGVQ